MALLHAGVATLALLCLLGLARAQGSQESEEKFAFLNPQSGCNIRCENGGVCAFSINNPRRHKCVCFVGMYYGTRCQHRHEVPKTPTSPVKEILDLLPSGPRW
uniref:EGF-like domain-containing protein n=1 Tax=Steinernema glaseri TaxID=37863 RepID=A0A1I7YD53_9BILA